MMLLIETVPYSRLYRTLLRVWGGGGTDFCQQFLLCKAKLSSLTLHRTEILMSVVKIKTVDGKRAFLGRSVQVLDICFLSWWCFIFFNVLSLCSGSLLFWALWGLLLL